MMTSSQEESTQPVSVVTSQVVKPGAEDEFEALLIDINQSLLSADGQLGVDVIRPADHDHPEFVTIFRFDSYDSLKKWQHSDAYRQWVEQVLPLADHEAKQEIVTGIEVWLTPMPIDSNVAESGSRGQEIGTSTSSASTGASGAPRSRQAAVIWLGIYPLVTLLIWLLEPYLGGLPIYLRTLVLTVILVLLMTYLVMPFLMRHLAGWVHGQ